MFVLRELAIESSPSLVIAGKDLSRRRNAGFNPMSDASFSSITRTTCIDSAPNVTAQAAHSVQLTPSEEARTAQVLLIEMVTLLD